MNYTKLSEIIEKIIDPSEITLTAEPINGDYNKAKITWKYSIKKSLTIKDDYIEIIHHLEFDMDSLMEIILKKGHSNVSKEIALIAIAINYDKSILLIYNNQKEELAELVIQKKGEALAYKTGI